MADFNPIFLVAMFCSNLQLSRYAREERANTQLLRAYPPPPTDTIHSTYFISTKGVPELSSLYLLSGKLIVLSPISIASYDLLPRNTGELGEKIQLSQEYQRELSFATLQSVCEEQFTEQLDFAFSYKFPRIASVILLRQ